MKSLWRTLAGLGVALCVVGCSNVDRPNLRAEFGLARPGHRAYYHHIQHHWHGVCCVESDHKWCGACSSDHACHHCGVVH